MKRKATLVVMVAFMVLTYSCITGCGAVGMTIGGSMKQYTVNKTLTLKQATPNILEIASNTGRELGYSVSGTDEQSVTLATDPSFFQMGFLGKTDISRMKIVKKNDKAIQVAFVIQGNFGVADEENAKKTYQQFEDKLLSKL